MVDVSQFPDQEIVVASGEADGVPWYGTVAIASGLFAVPLLILFVAVTDPLALGMRESGGDSRLSGTVIKSHGVTVEISPIDAAQLRLTTI